MVCVVVCPGEFQSSDYEMPEDGGEKEVLFLRPKGLKETFRPQLKLVQVNAN